MLTTRSTWGRSIPLLTRSVATSIRPLPFLILAIAWFLWVWGISPKRTRQPPKPARASLPCSERHRAFVRQNKIAWSKDTEASTRSIRVSALHSKRIARPSPCTSPPPRFGTWHSWKNCLTRFRLTISWAPSPSRAPNSPPGGSPPPVEPSAAPEALPLGVTKLVRPVMFSILESSLSVYVAEKQRTWALVGTLERKPLRWSS
mmetsp:Transcript_3678/g.12907  ORF Transcript_3678/g.12907 Transcript_3678/m.12907 type:complete len:203 (-) Transcript_3678:3057-3665(-)